MSPMHFWQLICLQCSLTKTYDMYIRFKTIQRITLACKQYLVFTKKPYLVAFILRYNSFDAECQARGLTIGIIFNLWYSAERDRTNHLPHWVGRPATRSARQVRMRSCLVIGNNSTFSNPFVKMSLFLTFTKWWNSEATFSIISVILLAGYTTHPLPLLSVRTNF